MSEADILAVMYEDKATVYRPFKTVLSSGESTFKNGVEGNLIYSELECSLSRQTGGKINQSVSVANTPTEYSLFTRPEIDIQPNDYLVILQRGKTIIATAGLAGRFSSHTNIPLKLKEDTV